MEIKTFLYSVQFKTGVIKAGVVRAHKVLPKYFVSHTFLSAVVFRLHSHFSTICSPTHPRRSPHHPSYFLVTMVQTTITNTHTQRHTHIHTHTHTHSKGKLHYTHTHTQTHKHTHTRRHRYL